MPAVRPFCYSSNCLNFVFLKSFSNLDWIKSDIASDSDYWDAPCSHHVGDSPLGYSNVICDLFTIVQTAWR